jgi:UDP:flavonoid glycosyltransferase YjiC (YdhE family)
MEPFLAIGEILHQKGHTITCMFPEQFRSLAEDSGFGFASLGDKFIKMLDSPAGRTAMGGGSLSLKKLKAYVKLIAAQQEVNKEMIIMQEEIIKNLKPDRIVHNGKVMYPVIWGLENNGKRVFVSPVPYMHYVKEHSHVAFNKNFGPFINKLTYQLANFGLIRTIASSLKWVSTSYRIKTKDIKKALFDNKAIYTISPSLFKRPEYWNDNLQVLGYHERKKTNNWEASEALNDFLKKHSKVILVTFGSMINTNPKEKTSIILEVLAQNNIPAIINTASGGLVKPKNYDKERFHFVDRIPYDWIFPKLYAVIHHGGSGTTHTAIKYGCASLIIPHIIDQYVWNKMVARKGIGPLGIDVSRITVKNLEAKIIDLFTNKSYKVKAEKLGKEIQSESFQEEIYKTIIE